MFRLKYLVINSLAHGKSSCSAKSSFHVCKKSISSLNQYKTRARPLININSVIVNHFGTYKTSTGLVGLKVDPDGRNTLLRLCGEVLESIQKIPATAQYRINVEKWFKYIEKVSKKHEQILDIEQEINLGQIEEIIVMAKDELELIQYYYDNKGWDLVESNQKEAEALIADMADSIYFSSPQDKPPAPTAAAPK